MDFGEKPPKQKKRATPAGNCSPILAFLIFKHSETARAVCAISYGIKKLSTPAGNCSPIQASLFDGNSKTARSS